MKNNKTSWQQFLDAGLIGVVIIVGLVLLAAYPPLALVYIAFGVAFIVAAKRQKPAPRAEMQPDGRWLVFDPQGFVYGEPCTKDEASRILRSWMK